MDKVKVGIVGCAGRMGLSNLQAVLAHPQTELAGGIEQTGSSLIGQDLGSLIGRPDIGLQATDDFTALAQASDVLIEFTSPKATLAHTEQAAALGTAMVIGTTGLNDDETAKLQALGARIPILWAPNMSLGVNLLLAVVEQVARATGPDFDAEIVEMHHRRKVDAPSGTAKAMGEAIIRGRGQAIETIYARDGITGARPRGALGYATLRGGDVIGDHTAIFAGDGERIEISHKASSREIYSQGAVRSALWLAGRTPGLYEMKNVLGI